MRFLLLWWIFVPVIGTAQVPGSNDFHTAKSIQILTREAERTLKEFSEAEYYFASSYQPLVEKFQSNLSELRRTIPRLENEGFSRDQELLYRVLLLKAAFVGYKSTTFHDIPILTSSDREDASHYNFLKQEPVINAALEAAAAMLDFRVYNWVYEDDMKKARIALRRAEKIPELKVFYDELKKIYDEKTETQTYKRDRVEKDVVEIEELEALKAKAAGGDVESLKNLIPKLTGDNETLSEEGQKFLTQLRQLDPEGGKKLASELNQKKWRRFAGRAARSELDYLILCNGATAGDEDAQFFLVTYLYEWARNPRIPPVSRAQFFQEFLRREKEFKTSHPARWERFLEDRVSGLIRDGAYSGQFQELSELASAGNPVAAQGMVTGLSEYSRRGRARGENVSQFEVALKGWENYLSSLKRVIPK